ncbi:hypothetical protein ES708_03961 [subsurface metagenome]
MKYLVTMNIAGEIHRVYRHAKDPNRAVLLARIKVAKLTGHLPDPWAIRVDDYQVKEVRNE